jgi:glycosyltransferase involved in cell wall biosynthesis
MSVNNSAHLPLLSILIPTYNRPTYLGDCLYSILYQDFGDFEIIVKDNHSDADKVAEYEHVLEKYQKLFINKGVELRYVKNDRNLGVVGNKHEGVIKNCEGKYCIVVDDDDFYINNKVLSLFVRTFQTTEGVAVVAGETMSYYEGPDSRSAKDIVDENASRITGASPLIVDGTEYFLGFWNRFCPLQCGVTMFDRQLAIDRGWPYLECNDQSIPLLLSSGKKVVIFSEELACHRIHIFGSQRINDSKQLRADKAFESHTVIIDWVKNARKYSNTSRFSLFVWRLKNILLKDEGPIRWLYGQSEEKLREYFELLKNYKYLDYYVQRYFSPQMIAYDYEKASKSENRFIRFFLKVMIGIRWATSKLILVTDRVLHDPEYRYKCRIDRLFYDTEYRYSFSRKVSRLNIGIKNVFLR